MPLLRLTEKFNFTTYGQLIYGTDCVEAVEKIGQIGHDAVKFGNQV